MRDKIHILVSLTAALVMTIVCIILKASLLEAASKLIITIIVFYIVGLIVEDYIKLKIFPIIPDGKSAGNLESATENGEPIQDEDEAGTNDYDYHDEETSLENDY